MKELRNESTERLLKVFRNMKSDDDLFALLLDLCTIKEIEDMSQRLETAILLNNKVNYETITQTNGMSAATISRVSKCLNYGSGGYDKAISLLKELEDEKK